MPDPLKTLASVKEYYGKVLKTSRDLKTDACCSISGCRSTSGI